MAKPESKPSKEIGKPLTREQINIKIALTGNLAGLSNDEKWLYYQQYCEYLGLDPITRPFDLITTYETGPNGERIEKTVLYANASCSAQLAGKYQITYGKPIKEYDGSLGIYTISAEAVLPGGLRACWRSGVAHVQGMKGKQLENAIKKAETQAHRRATLALCGVAMSDESEIEDIEGARAVPIAPGNPATCMGGIYEEIGELLKPSGQDGSGARNYVLSMITSGAIQAAAAYLNTTDDVIINIKKRMTAEAHKQIEADLNAAQKGIEELGQGHAPLISEESIHYPQPPAQESNGAPTSPAADPVSSIQVTLSTAQQRVADASMTLMKEHKKSRAEIVTVICEAAGRKVEKSADLDEAEAEKVYKQLETWASTLSGLKDQPEQKAAPVVFNQRNRNHNEESAKRLDAVYMKLVGLKVGAGAMLDKLNEVIARELKADPVETRYALDDECVRTICDFFEEWADQLEKEKSA